MPADPGAGALTVARFDKALHDRSAFACGHGPIDNFLKSSLSDQIRLGLIAAWMATRPPDPAVLGFYTLGALAVRADLGPASWGRARVPDIPVLYIRALAVRTDHQGTGLGTALLIDALRRCLGLSAEVGAAAVVLDVLQDDKTERRQRFYRNLGFRPLGDPENPGRMFIPMADIRASLAPIHP